MAKAILQYTAQPDGDYNALTQGAGFLNAEGAVTLARYYRTAKSGDWLSLGKEWGKQINWGSHRLAGGFPLPTANAFELGTVWGSARDRDGDNIVWGTVRNADNIVWGTLLDADNIVWGTLLDGDNIVWGTVSDNIVWGTDCGGADCDNIVWGTIRDDDNIVWGTLSDLDNIVWGTLRDDDNIVWGTADVGDNIVWGTSTGEVDPGVWATSAGEETVLFEDPNSAPIDFSETPFESLIDNDITSLDPTVGATTAGIGSTTTGGL
jgi:hypothetical protein